VDTIHEHKRHADELRSAATNDGGEAAAAMRAAVLARGGGGEPVPEPYDTLAAQIGEAAYKVTDMQVAAVREAAGSDKAAFEIIMAASIGAGLARWDTAIRVIDEARHASS
jgi:hypothetical protein